MAKARPTAKKRRIVIAKPEEDKGDLQISSSEAKLRLTPKLFLTIFLLIAASVAVVVVAVRYSGRTLPAASPMTAGHPGTPGEKALPQSPNQPPQVQSAGILPERPDAASPLDIKYAAMDQEGDAVTYTFRWFVNGSQVQEGPSSALQPGPYRNGDVVFAEVVPADANSQGTPFRTEKVTIIESALSVAGVTLSPQSPSIGDIITASPAGGSAGENNSYRYQWHVNGEAVGSPGPENTFDTRSLKKRDSVFVAMTTSDGTRSSGAVRSGMIFIQNRKPEILSSAPESLQGSSYTYQVVAKDPDGDVLKYRLDQAPAGMTINETSGLIQWSLKKDTMYAGRNEAVVRVVADDGDGGTASQDFTIVFTDLYVQ